MFDHIFAPCSDDFPFRICAVLLRKIQLASRTIWRAAQILRLVGSINLLDKKNQKIMKLQTDKEVSSLKAQGNLTGLLSTMNGPKPRLREPLRNQ
jgi:hypothetical protein